MSVSQQTGWVRFRYSGVGNPAAIVADTPGAIIVLGDWIAIADAPTNLQWQDTTGAAVDCTFKLDTAAGKSLIAGRSANESGNGSTPKGKGLQLANSAAAHIEVAGHYRIETQ